jgi:hypothetical protein
MTYKTTRPTREDTPLGPPLVGRTETCHWQKLLCRGRAATPGQAPPVLLRPPRHHADRIMDGQGVAPNRHHRLHH